MINIHDLYQVMRLRCWYLLVERNKKFWRDAGWPGSLNTNIAKQRSFNSRDILKVTTETKELKSWTNVYSPDWNQNLTVKTSTTSLALPWNCAPGGGARASLAKNWIPSPLPLRARGTRGYLSANWHLLTRESPSADPVVMMLNHSPGSEGMIR